MIHECNLNCYTMDPTKISDLGIEDTGKWMPFIFNVDMVEAAKLSSDEDDHPLYNCTTIFTKTGDTYIIDTPFKKFFQIFKEYYTDETASDDSSNDLDL